MDWVVTSPPAKTIARCDGSDLDVLAIRVPSGEDVGPGLVPTEFLLSGSGEQPFWEPISNIEGSHVVA